MLSAHSRKLETRPLAAHQLSHRGPPLARTGSPVGGPNRDHSRSQKGDRKLPTAAARAEKCSPEDSNCDPGFCPELSLEPF